MIELDSSYYFFISDADPNKIIRIRLQDFLFWIGIRLKPEKQNKKLNFPPKNRTNPYIKPLFKLNQTVFIFIIGIEDSLTLYCNSTLTVTVKVQYFDFYL